MAHHHPHSALATSRRRDVAPESVDLLRRAQRGDREAFGRLYAEHLSVITRYVAVRLRDRDRHAIPDVVHDAFTDALAELAGAHDDVRGWLLQLAARACTRHGWVLRTLKIIYAGWAIAAAVRVVAPVLVGHTWAGATRTTAVALEPPPSHQMTPGLAGAPSH